MATQQYRTTNFRPETLARIQQARSIIVADEDKERARVRKAIARSRKGTK